MPKMLGKPIGKCVRSGKPFIRQTINPPVRLILWISRRIPVRSVDTQKLPWPRLATVMHLAAKMQLADADTLQ
jgi:hypothetical protein